MRVIVWMYYYESTSSYYECDSMDALNQAQLRSRSPRQFYDEAKFIGATVGPQGRIWQHVINSSTTLLFSKAHLVLVEF